MTTWRISSPIAVGGLGGSGTRAVAEILQTWGFYLGADLNPQMDNLWFTLMFKRRSCLRDLMLLHAHIVEAQYSPFAAAMQGRRLGPAGLSQLLRATLEMAVRGHNHYGEGKGLWAFKRAFTMLTAPRPSPADHVGWGWKEPNTHVYLRLLAACEPNLRYIHVIRHGLDMAFCRNEQQLHLWGPLYDLEIAPRDKPTPVQKLYYWIRANRRALNTGAWMGPARFFAIRFDDLCHRPEPTLSELAGFLGLDNADFDAAKKCVRPPSSLGRYKHEDLSGFREDQINMVRELGFEVEGFA